MSQSTETSLASLSQTIEQMDLHFCKRLDSIIAMLESQIAKAKQSYDSNNRQKEVL